MKAYSYRNSTDALPSLLAHLQDAPEVGSRNGRTRELTHVGITLTEPLERELLVAGRKPNIAAQVAETAWVLAGRADIGWLSNYLPRAADFSDDGKTWRGGYGPRLRSWPVRDGEGASVVDQLAYVVDTLRSNPLSRQAVISLWDPQVDTNPGLDRPCNDLLVLTSRFGYLDLHVSLRSNDIIWGWSGINAFEWSVLMEVVARLLGINVGQLHFSTTSFHIYEHHWRRSNNILAATRASLSAAVWPSPAFAPPSNTLDSLDSLLEEWFTLEQAIREGEPVEDGVDRFPEPMLQSWLRVLQWWWTGDTDYLRPLEGTRLAAAAEWSVQPPSRQPVDDGPTEEKVFTFGSDKPLRTIVQHTKFLDHVHALHLEKDAAYGNSWKARGEQMAIMANIARKVDRLGAGNTSDETQVDTSMDLLVYLAKYRVWLAEHNMGAPRAGRVTAPDSSDPHVANEVMATVERRHSGELADHKGKEEQLEAGLRNAFEELTFAVTTDGERYLKVDAMLAGAYLLARLRWEHQEWKARNEKRMWKGYE